MKQNMGTKTWKIDEQSKGTHAKRKLQEFPLDKYCSIALLEKKHKRGCEQIQGEINKVKLDMFDGQKNIEEA